MPCCMKGESRYYIIESVQNSKRKRGKEMKSDLNCK